jgi:hypothetical protein
MRRLSKLGAGALALMLSATLVFPITANAEQSSDYYTKTGSDTVINENATTYKITGTATVGTPGDGETVDDMEDRASEYAELDAWKKAVEQGLAKEGTFAKYNAEARVYDATSKKYVSYYFQYPDEDGWSDTGRFDLNKERTTYSYFLTIKKTAYKNTVTGETASRKSDLTGVDFRKVNVIPKKASVYTGGYTDIGLKLRAGNISVKKVKSSNKKVVQARAFNTETNKTSSNYVLSKDLKGYYYTINNEKFYVNEGTVVNESTADVTLRVYGKKAGKAVVSFDIVDVNGKTTGSAKITVISGKTKPIASITFAGKSLDQGDVIGTSNNKYIYNKQDVNAISSYTTAKSGKLKVTPSDGYKLVRIQMGTLDKFTYDTSQDPTHSTIYDSSYDGGGTKHTNKTVIETTSESHPVDLNNDGDYDDVIDGVSERSVTFKYKTVKNNKKITLSKVTSYSKKTYQYGTAYTENPEADYSYEQTLGGKDGENKAPTSIKVTLYNRAVKDYVDVYYTIYKKVKTY